MLLCLAGSLVWASDPARPTGFSPAIWTELDPDPLKKYKEYLWFSRVFILWFLYFYIMKKTNLVFRIRGF